MTINQLLRSSFLAGVCIGIAGFGYLASKDIIGAVLFAFGLLTVVHYALKLYTGLITSSTSTVGSMQSIISCIGL